MGTKISCLNDGFNAAKIILDNIRTDNSRYLLFFSLISGNKKSNDILNCLQIVSVHVRVGLELNHFNRTLTLVQISTTNYDPKSSETSQQLLHVVAKTSTQRIMSRDLSTLADMYTVWKCPSHQSVTTLLEKTTIPWILFVPQKIPQQWNNDIDRLQRRHRHVGWPLTKELQ